MALSGFLHKGRRVSEWFGRHQNWYLQLGIAGFIIAGVHLGADRIDDGCFAVLNFIDAGFEDMVNRFFGLILHFGWIGLDRARELSLGFADLVDVEAREAASAWVAVAVELWVDFRLGRAALGYREDPAFGTGLFDMVVELGRTARGLAGRARALVDVELITLPLSLFIGLIASAYVVYVVAAETFNQLFAWLAGSSGAGAVIATILAYFVTAMVVWSLGFRALTSALRYVEGRAERARADFVGRWRGLALILIVLPVCAVGSLFGTPVGGLF